MFAALALAGLTLCGAALAQTEPDAAAQAIQEKRVNLNLENADLRYALKLLFDAVDVNYILDRAVQGTVTASLTNIPFGKALGIVLRSAQSQELYTYRVEDGVYIITLRDDAKDVVIDKVNDPDDTPLEPEKRTVKIQINFADAVDIATALGGGVFPSRATRDGLFGGGFGSGFGSGNGFGNSFGGMNGGFGNSGFGSGSFGNGFGNGFGNSGGNIPGGGPGGNRPGTGIGPGGGNRRP
jgi:hypothetical protein